MCRADASMKYTMQMTCCCCCCNTFRHKCLRNFRYEGSSNYDYAKWTCFIHVYLKLYTRKFCSWLLMSIETEHVHRASCIHLHRGNRCRRCVVCIVAFRVRFHLTAFSCAHTNRPLILLIRMSNCMQPASASRTFIAIAFNCINTWLLF